MNTLKHFLLNGYNSYENMEGGNNTSSPGSIYNSLNTIEIEFFVDSTKPIDQRLINLENLLFKPSCKFKLQSLPNEARIKLIIDKFNSLNKYTKEPPNYKFMTDNKEIFECDNNETVEKYLDDANIELLNNAKIYVSNTPISSPTYNNLLIKKRDIFTEWPHYLYQLVIKTTPNIHRLEIMKELERNLDINPITQEEKEYTRRLINIEKKYKLQNIAEFI